MKRPGSSPWMILVNTVAMPASVAGPVWWRSMSEPVEDAAESAVSPDDAIVLDDEVLDAGILTLPNAITVVRPCTLPVFVYLLFGADDRWAAGWVLFLIGSTDWLDGYLARRPGQVSNVGKVLDPVADRLLFFVDRKSPVLGKSVSLRVDIG